MPKVHHNTDTMCLNDLSIGDWFLRENKLFLKISNDTEINVYCADNGCIYYLSKESDVKYIHDDCIEIYENGD